jgi:hypothetical protein
MLGGFMSGGSMSGETGPGTRLGTTHGGGSDPDDGRDGVECEDARRWQRIARWAASVLLSSAACVGLAAASGEITRDPHQDSAREKGPEKRETAQKNEGKRDQNEERTTSTEMQADLSLLDEVDQACWAKLAAKRIYFAHQHRGDELVLGLHDVLASRPSIGWTVRAQSSFAAGEQLFGKPGFVHGPAGADGEPERKIDRFVAFLRSGEGTQVDLAVMDFSMHDFDRNTDPEKLIEYYQQAIETLHRERPSLQVFVATVPLACPEKGVRERMRRMMGTTGNVANAVRGRFNDLLRAEFGHERTIDFAHAESERPDMTHCSVIVGGVRWPARCVESVVDPAKAGKSDRDNKKSKNSGASGDESTRTTEQASQSSSKQGNEALTRAARQALAREMMVAFARTCEAQPATTSAVGTD